MGPARDSWVQPHARRGGIRARDPREHPYHSQMAVPERLGGRFDLGEQVASGGMGAVFRARDLETGEEVALKLLLGGGSLSSRFEREVGALSQLRHPGVVRYIAHGEAPDGRLYLAMEWLDGEELAERIARGPLDVRRALALVGSVRWGAPSPSRRNARRSSGVGSSPSACRPSWSPRRPTA